MQDWVSHYKNEEETISKVTVAQIKTVPRAAAVKHMRQLANISAKRLYRAKGNLSFG